jgi:hypothetical protein
LVVNPAPPPSKKPTVLGWFFSPVSSSVGADSGNTATDVHFFVLCCRPFSVSAKDAATGIVLSAVAGTLAANYQTCHENAEQPRALQAGAKETSAAAKQ